MEVANQKNRVTLISTGASTTITNDNCTATNVHWTYDTYALAVGTGRAVVANGGDTWFFLTADYAFGHSLEGDTAAVVKESGGKVLGNVRHPFPNADFSSFLLQAQASGAKIIGLANAGADTTNAIKQAKEFGITPTQTLAGLLVFITDIRSLGLETAQGHDAHHRLLLGPQRRDPRLVQALLRAPQGPAHHGAGGRLLVPDALLQGHREGRHRRGRGHGEQDEGAAGQRRMFATNGKVRADGRMVHDMYLAQVKTPAESKGEWDYYKIIRTIPGRRGVLPPWRRAPARW